MMIREKIKNIVYLHPYYLIAILLSGLIFSCSSDIDNGYLSEEFRLDFSTVKLSNNKLSLLTDNNYTISDSTLSRVSFTKKNGQRVIANYTPLANGNNTIHSVTDILTSKTIKGRFDTLYTAPVKIQSIWTGGGYINLILTFNRYSKTHSFGLYYKNSATDTLQLSHNDMGDSQGYPVRTYMSFLIDGLKINSTDDSIPIHIKVPDSNGFGYYTINIPASSDN